MKAWTTVAQLAGLDLVVTNVPVLYGHADGTALHALARGGLIGGFAHEDGRRKRAGGTCVATSYPLVSGDPAVRVLGGERLSNSDVPLGLAALMAHELGHLLLGLGDNYEHRRCLMRPPAGLEFHRWWLGTTPVRSCALCNLSTRLRELILREAAASRAKWPSARGQAGCRLTQLSFRACRDGQWSSVCNRNKAGMTGEAERGPVRPGSFRHARVVTHTYHISSTGDASRSHPRKYGRRRAAPFCAEMIQVAAYHDPDGLAAA